MSSVASERIARRRAGAPHTSMFLRMLVRAAVLRRGRAASALLAMVVAAAVATAMLNLYVDVQAKLRREFRKYGANVVVVARDGHELPADALAKAQAALGAGGMALPIAYAVARTADGHSVVVAGTDLEQAQKLDSWWSVTAWPKAAGDALVGTPRGRNCGFAGKAVQPELSGTNPAVEFRRHLANRRGRGQPGLYFSRGFH